jgi:hypothetical protein
MSKPSKKVSITMPTLEEDEKITEDAANDPDALPLTEEQINRMVPLKTIRGRPRLASKKQGHVPSSGVKPQARMP